MGRRIVITSGKGGVGKTTLTANLGLMLSLTGAGVALIDADVGLNNLDVALGAENKVIFDLGDVISGRCRIKQALIKDTRSDSLYLLPSAKINSENITVREFSSVVAEISALFDYVLIDCPAGIDEGFHRSVMPAEEAIIVTTPHISAVRDADKVAGLLSTYELKSVSLAVNRVRGDMLAKGNMMPPVDISELLRVPLSAVIPESDALSMAGMLDAGVKDKVYKAYKMFSDVISGAGGGVFDCERGYKGLFRKFKRN